MRRRLIDKYPPTIYQHIGGFTAYRDSVLVACTGRTERQAVAAYHKQLRQRIKEFGELTDADEARIGNTYTAHLVRMNVALEQLAYQIHSHLTSPLAAVLKALMLQKGAKN